MVMGTFLFKEELSVTECLCLAEGFQMQGYLKDFLPVCCVHKNLPSAFEVLGQESQFSLDSLLAPCTWQRLQPAGRGKRCVSGAEVEAGHP